MLEQPVAVIPAGVFCCHRFVCRRPIADWLNTWWNHSTEQWYCQKCAILINDSYPGLLVRRLHPDVAALIDEKAGPELSSKEEDEERA